MKMIDRLARALGILLTKFERYRVLESLLTRFSLFTDLLFSQMIVELANENESRLGTSQFNLEKPEAKDWRHKNAKDASPLFQVQLFLTHFKIKLRATQSLIFAFAITESGSLQERITEKYNDFLMIFTAKKLFKGFSFIFESVVLMGLDYFIT